MPKPPVRILPKSPSTTELADKAYSLDALRTAVDDAAKASGRLWVSYVLALFYFLIAAGGVTHKDMFLERPVKLPFLGVDLPIVGFFTLAPPIFVMLHAYVLLTFTVMARKVEAFNAALLKQVPNTEQQQAMRQQLPSSPFVQSLVGPRELRYGLIGWLLGAVAIASLMLGPVALLLFLQMQFLPYHSYSATWSARLSLCADLVLLWRLWRWLGFLPLPFPNFGFSRLPRLLPQAIACTPCCVGTLATIWLAFCICTFPGEKLDDLGKGGWLRETLIDGTSTGLDENGNTVAFDPYLRGVDPISHRPTTWLTNRLVLMDFDIAEDTRFESKEKFELHSVTFVLRAHDLRRAVLSNSDLRKADLTGAVLIGAMLNGAKLDHAKLDGAQLRGASLETTSLQGASLRGAALDGAKLNGAQLQATSMIGAQLVGARIESANLTDSILDGANLQDANLTDSNLSGSSLKLAILRRTILRNANLSGVNFDRSEMQMANLEDANCEGASFDFTNMQGALLLRTNLSATSFHDSMLQLVDFDDSKIIGASFDHTGLQGASLFDSDLSYSIFSSPYVWHSNVFHLREPPILVISPIITNDDATSRIIESTKKILTYLQIENSADRKKFNFKDFSLEYSEFIRAAAHSSQFQSDEDWRQLSTRPQQEEDFIERGLAKLGCLSPNARFVIPGIVRNFIRLRENNMRPTLIWIPAQNQLAQHFLDSRCLGASRIDQEIRDELTDFLSSRPKFLDDLPPRQYPPPPRNN